MTTKPLNDLLDDLYAEDEATVLAAIRALGERRALAAFDDLLRVWRDHFANQDAIAEAVRAAIAAMGPAVIPLALAFMRTQDSQANRMDYVAAKGLGALGEAAVPALRLAALRPPLDDVRIMQAMTIIVLTEIGPATLPVVYEIFCTTTIHVRQTMVGTFKKLGATALPHFEALLTLPEPNYPVLAMMLGALGPATTPAALHLLHDANPNHRWMAARALHEHQVGALVPTLAAVLDDPDPDVAAEAAWSLAKVAPPPIDVLIEMLQHPLSKVQRAGAKGLERASDLASLQALLDRLHTDDVHVRLAALGAIGNRIQQAAVKNNTYEALLQCLDDPSPDVRYRAANFVGRCGRVQAVPRLLAMLDDHERCQFGPRFPVYTGVETGLRRLDTPEARAALEAAQRRRRQVREANDRS